MLIICWENRLNDNILKFYQLLSLSNEFMMNSGFYLKFFCIADLSCFWITFIKSYMFYLGNIS